MYAHRLFCTLLPQQSIASSCEWQWWLHRLSMPFPHAHRHLTRNPCCMAVGAQLWAFWGRFHEVCILPQWNLWNNHTVRLQKNVCRHVPYMVWALSMVLSLSACCDYADTCSVAKIQASVLFLDSVTSCHLLQHAQAGLTSVYRYLSVQLYWWIYYFQLYVLILGSWKTSAVIKTGVCNSLLGKTEQNVVLHGIQGTVWLPRSKLMYLITLHL